MNGGKNNSVHSQKHISMQKMEQLRSNTQLGHHEQYGPSSQNLVSQSQNFDFKKNSLPSNNSRRRQGGQSLQPGAFQPNQYQQAESMPDLVTLSGAKVSSQSQSSKNRTSGRSGNRQSKNYVKKDNNLQTITLLP